MYLIRLCLFIALTFVSFSCFTQKIVDSKIAEIDSLTRMREGEKAYAALEELSVELDSKPSSDRKIQYFQYYSLLEAENGSLEKFNRYLDSAFIVVKEKHQGIHNSVPELFTQRINTLSFIDKVKSKKYLEEFRDYLDSNPNSDGEANYLRLLGIQEALSGKLHSAIFFYEESMIKGGFYNSKYEAESYINLDFFYTNTNQTDIARKYKVKTLEVLSRQNPKNHLLMSQLYQVLAMAENEKFTVSASLKAIEYANISIDHARKNDNNYNRILSSMLDQLAAYSQLAILENNDKEINKSIQLCESIIEYEKEAKTKNAPLDFNFAQIAHSLLADFFVRIDDLDLALEYNDKSKGELKKEHKNYQKYFANHLWRKAMIQAKSGIPKDAIGTFQQAICALKPKKLNCEDENEVPIFSDVNKEWNSKLCESQTNAYLDLYSETQDSKFLDYGQQSFLLYDSVRTDYFEKNNYSINRASEMFTGTRLFGTKYQSTENESDFYQAMLYAEKQKNIVLVKKIYAYNLKSNSNYTAAEARNLARLKEAYDIQKSIAEQALLSGDSTAEDHSVQLNAIEKPFRDLQAKLAQKYPVQKSSILGKVFDEKYLKSYLEKSNNETIIEYQFAGNQLIILVHNEDRQTVEFVDIDPKELKADIFKLREYLESRKSIDSLNFYAKRLYSILIAPIKSSLVHEQLLIIPDDFLAFIPFDILVDEQDQYLIHSKTIRYAKSIIFEKIMHEQARGEQNGKLLAIAASPEMNLYASIRSDSIRSGLGALPGAKSEISLLKNLIQGKFLLNGAAKESDFKSESKPYSALHLAMHGLIDQDVPSLSRLVFSQENGDKEGLLYAYEIQNLQLNADLVTLSACNSGFGNYLAGEGVASLASSFALAGAPNTIASLWAVHDKASAKIMDQLYKNLLDGEPKHKALQKAKLSYIQSQPVALQHPYYWSGFVYYGDDQAIELKKKSNSPIFIIGLLLLSLAIFFILYSRMKRSSKSKVA